MDIEGRCVVVTGAASGIGRALAERFHAGGANLCVADVDAAGAATVAAGLNERRPGSAIDVAADVSSEAGNVELIRNAEATFGFVDVFWANAGRLLGGELETTESDWSMMFDVNVHAHRWAAKHLVPTWLERGEGYFCSTASAAGLLTQIGNAPYSLTKHAALAFAEWLAITYGDRGVRVSCLCPLGVNTNLLRDEPADGLIWGVLRSGGPVLEPADVAEVAYQGVTDERFLIAPHPELMTYWSRKSADYERWLRGMRRLRSQLVGAE